MGEEKENEIDMPARLIARGEVGGRATCVCGCVGGDVSGLLTSTSRVRQQLSILVTLARVGRVKKGGKRCVFYRGEQRAGKTRGGKRGT